MSYHLKYRDQSFVLVVLLSLFGLTFSLQAASIASLDKKNHAVIVEYCHECHNEKKHKGKVRLDDLSPQLGNLATAERWQAVLDVINAGDMPPEDEKQIPKDIKTNLLDDLSNVMVQARENFLDKGGEIAMRRLNVREYKNTLRDMLGVEISVNELPSDAQVHSFDTLGVNLFMSSHQIKTYRRLGREALDQAFLWFANRDIEQSLRFDPEDKYYVMGNTIRHREKYEKTAKAWLAAARKVIEQPENAETVKELMKKVKHKNDLLHHWEKIKGIPSPHSYGVQNGGFGYVNNALKDAQWSVNGGYGLKRPYSHYLKDLSHQDKGLWLAIGAHWKDQFWGVFGNYYCLNLPYEWDKTYPGEYLLRIRLAHAEDAPPERRFVEVGINTRDSIVLGTYQVNGSLKNPEILEVPIRLSRENILPYEKVIGPYGNKRSHEIYIKERVDKDTRSFFSKGKKENGIGPKAAIWVDWMSIERVHRSGNPLPAGLQALQPVIEDEQPDEGKIVAAFETFCKVAFRSEMVSEAYLKGLLGLYKLREKAGMKSHDAIKHVLAIVLSSPRFLYRVEPKKNEEEKRKLTANELSVRLSYFLWGSPPDAELQKHATSGDLLKPEVLAAQTHRMMNDSKFRDFIVPFMDQWLEMERFDLFEVDRKKHPDFDEAAKRSARWEIYETMAYLFKENRSLMDLLKSDYIVVDPVMAKYYGIKGFSENGFHKVSLPEKSPRGGLLGMAGVHFMGSDGINSNPVERGVWVLRKILNDPPPPAPANVPQFARLSDKLLTKKERLKLHQSDSQCASCHRKIDPIGFGLENFNAVGVWRNENIHQVKKVKAKKAETQTKSWKIDVSGQFHKGPAFKSYHEMRDLIYDKKDDFCIGFIEALLEYSLGRNVGFSDEALVQTLLKSVRDDDYKVRSAIHAIVQNNVFQVK